MAGIEISTPARLHFGQLDLNGSLGRFFGGFGVALESPNCVFRFSECDDVKVLPEGFSYLEETVHNFLDKLINRGDLPAGDKANGVKIEIERIIENHIGLGSDTQIGLSIALGISRLFGLNLEVEECARLIDRKHSRSGIGYGACKYGGFILDAGRTFEERQNDTYLPPVIFHHPVPEDWIFLLVLPETDHRGLCGKKEIRTFEELPPMQERFVEENSRRILMQIIPGLIEDRIEVFGEALTAIQRNVGDYFKQVQGSRFATPCSQEIVDQLLKWGAVGAGQSSWGPGLYGLIRGREEALELQKRIQDSFKEKISWTTLTKAENRPCRILKMA